MTKTKQVRRPQRSRTGRANVKQMLGAAHNVARHTHEEKGESYGKGKNSKC